MRIAGLLCAAALALAAAGTAPEESYAEARAAAVSELIDDIGAYAGWCTGAQLFAERDRAWMVVLSFEPENVKAHKALGHKKDKDGNWVPNERRKPPEDRDAVRLKAAPERWAKAVGPYRDRILTLLEEHGDELGPKERQAAIEELLALNPDDQVLRARNGEVQLDGAWVLRETAMGKKRRPALKAVVAEAFGSAPMPQRIAPDEHEDALGIAWTEAWGTPLVRVLTTGSAQEAQRAAQAAHAAGALFEATCGAPAIYPEHLRFLLLAGAGDKASLLASHPGTDTASRAFLERLVGSCMPGGADFAWWSETPAHRLDGVSRGLLSWFMQESYGLSPAYGWAHEGLGLYLTRELVGTRLNWFGLPSEHSTTAENQAFLAKLYDTSVNWMNEAYLMLQGEHPPRFRQFMKKEVNALTAEELLYSYVLAAYLFEGRPAEAPELLRRVGAGEDQAEAVQAVLGLGVDALDGRLVTWLAQRR